MIFTFTWAPLAGADLGASADGRLAGTPIAHGLTPQAQGMRQGLTSAIRSHTGLSIEQVTGGSTSMWDLDPELARPETVSALLQTFVELGGQIFQGNMTDPEDLVRARENPAEYPNLFVRVGGFSARFVTLSSALQEEIIKRYRHRG